MSNGTETTPSPNSPPPEETTEAGTETPSLLDKTTGESNTSDPAPDQPETKEDGEKKEGEPEAPDPITMDMLELPEGFDKEDPLGEEFLKVINSPERDPKAAAQNLINLYEKLHERNLKAWSDQNAEWAEAVKNDPKIGGEKLDANLGKISRVMTEYASENGGAKTEEGLREAFTVTGAGNHPLIVGFLVWASNQLGEGGPLSGSPAGDQPMSAAQKLYGSQT